MSEFSFHAFTAGPTSSRPICTPSIPLTTLAWISSATGMDSNGLWAVGATLVAIGTTFGTAMMLGLASAVEALADNRRTSRRIRSSDA